MRFLKIVLIIMFFPLSLVFLFVKKRTAKPPKFVPYTLSDVENKHFDYLDIEMKMYRVMTKSNNPFGETACKLEKICLEDIALAPAVWKAMKSTCAAHPNYPAFRMLVTIYEKRGNYEEAIKICKKAIHEGYSDDGTKYGMRGRMNRIIKKRDRVS